MRLLRTAVARRSKWTSRQDAREARTVKIARLVLPIIKGYAVIDRTGFNLSHRCWNAATSSAGMVEMVDMVVVRLMRYGGANELRQRIGGAEQK